MTLFNLNYFLKTLSPNTVILGIKTSTYQFCGDKIQSTAPALMEIMIS